VSGYQVRKSFDKNKKKCPGGLRLIGDVHL